MNKNKIIFLVFILVIACMFFISDNFDNKKNESPHILNLVLYSTDNGGSYDKMKELTQSYYKQFSNVKTVYYRFEKNIKTPYELKGNVLLVKGEETYIPGILQKTVDAFEYFKPSLNQYDFIIRSNISTIIQFDKLSDELRVNPIQYGCGLCWGIENADKPEKDRGHIYSSGTSIILSSATVSRILENKQFMDETVIDDVSIGELISKKMPDVKMKPVFKNVPNNGFAFVPNFNNQTKSGNTLNRFLDENSDQIVFYRNHNGDRELDVLQMTQIIDYLDKKKH